MNPIHFPEKNKVLQPPIGAASKVVSIEPLAVWTDGEQCISCWRMTWRERLFALFHGRVWLAVLSGPTQPAVWIQAERTPFKSLP